MYAARWLPRELERREEQEEEGDCPESVCVRTDSGEISGKISRRKGFLYYYFFLCAEGEGEGGTWIQESLFLAGKTKMHGTKTPEIPAQVKLA